MAGLRLLGKSLLYPYEEPGFNPQTLSKNTVWLQVSGTPAQEGGDGRVTETNWPVSLPKMVCPRSSETSYLKVKCDSQNTPDPSPPLALSPTHISIHTPISTHSHKHIHAHIFNLGSIKAKVIF